MGFKKKWKDNSDERLTESLNKVAEIIIPLFEKNGPVELSNFDKENDLAHLLALILNCKLVSSEEKNVRSFGADNVKPIKLEILNNQILKYWGKIYWLSIPKEHECFQSYKDTFYGEFRLSDNNLEIIQILFGNYANTDLDGTYWVNDEIEWMYEL